jgi:hypothetical protein
MKRKSKLWVVVCVCSLLLFAGSCDDDDDVMADQQVSSSQAEGILADVVPAIIDFSLSVVALVQASAPAPPPVADKAVQGAVCSPIPGVETDYLCMEPNDGVICPVNATTSEWQFTDCLADDTTVDGTVTVVGTGPFLLTFDLTLDGSETVTGDMTITFGTTCDTVVYDHLVLAESGVSSNLVGTLQGCSGVPAGQIDATINAPGLRTFVAEISIDKGVTIVVLDGQNLDPLYLCTCIVDPFDPDLTACSCAPYSNGV